MLKLADEDIKIGIMTIFHIFKTLWRDTEDFLKIQIELLEMNTIIHEMKNILDGLTTD